MKRKTPSQKKSQQFCVVLVACGSSSEAKKIAHAAVGQRLAGCVNIFPYPIQSVYRWKRKVETAREYLLLIKTVENQLAALQRLVGRLHRYEVPEFIALPIATGSNEYLQWLSESTAAPRSPAKK